MKTISAENLRFYVLVRSRDSYDFLLRCLDSVLAQNYANYRILFVDDASNYSKKERKNIRSRLHNHISVFNRTRKFSVYNAYHLIHKYAENDNGVVVNLDGDDWLFDRNVLSYLARVYRRYNCRLTYGECVIWNGKNFSAPSRTVKRFTNVPYPKKIVADGTYRKYPFLPLHPRTWKVWLFKKIGKKNFLRPDGSWLRFAEDQALFYPMLEIAKGNYAVIRKPLYVYNTSTRNSDVKANLAELLKDELTIRKKPVIYQGFAGVN